MSNHAFARSFGSLAIIVLLSAHGARAEVAAWDQTQVTALAKQLTTAADALYEALLKQPPPHVGSMQSQPYYRLKQVVRLLRTEAHVLESAVAQGEGREPTLPVYENLMQLTRTARDDAGRVFVAGDLGERAAAVRGILNRLGPYYDPDFATIPPHSNIEPGSTR